MSGADLQGTGEGADGLTARQIFLDLAGAIASSAQPLSLSVDRVAARAGAGGLYLHEGNTLAVEDVSVTVDSVQADGSLQTLQSGTKSDLRTSGDGAVAVEVAAGDLVIKDGTAPFDGVGVSAGAGAITLKAPAGAIELDAALATTGAVTLEAGDRLLPTTSGSARLVDTQGTLALSVGSGIGRYPGNPLRATAATVELSQSSAGASFLALSGDTVWQGGALADGSDLEWTQESGSLTFTGSPFWGDGSVEVRNAGGALALAADTEATATGRVQLVADSLSLGAGSRLEAGPRGLAIATFGNVSMAADAVLRSQGNFRLRTRGDAALATTEASGELVIEVKGDLSRTATEEDERLAAPIARVRVEGDLGSADDPVKTATDRLDLDAGGDTELSESDSLVVGRYGVVVNSSTGDSSRIFLEDTGGRSEMRSSGGGSIEDRGSGVLELAIDDPAVLKLPIVNWGSGLKVTAPALEQEYGGTVLITPGKLNLRATDPEGGVGTAGGALTFRAAEIAATALNGSLWLQTDESTRVAVGDTVSIDQAASTDSIHWVLTGGDLEIAGAVRNPGSGAVSLEVQQGDLRMTNAAAVVQGSGGGLTVEVGGEGEFTRLDSGDGTLRLVGDRLVRSSLYSLPNLSSRVQAEVEFTGRVDLSADVPEVDLNGTVIVRQPGESAIELKEENP